MKIKIFQKPDDYTCKQNYSTYSCKEVLDFIPHMIKCRFESRHSVGREFEYKRRSPLNTVFDKINPEIIPKAIPKMYKLNVTIPALFGNSAAVNTA